MDIASIRVVLGWLWLSYNLALNLGIRLDLMRKISGGSLALISEEASWIGPEQVVRCPGDLFKPEKGYPRYAGEDKEVRLILAVPLAETVKGNSMCNLNEGMV